MNREEPIEEVEEASDHPPTGGRSTMPPAEDTGLTVDQEVDAARVEAGLEMAEDENRERADAVEPEERGEFDLSSTRPSNPGHAKHG